MMNHSFVAIDFETAAGCLESACSMGIVLVFNGEISDEYYSGIPNSNRKLCPIRKWQS